MDGWQIMAKWHYARELWPLAEQALGHTKEQRLLHMSFEPIVNKLWEAGERDFSWYDTPMYAYSCVACFLDFSKTNAGFAAQFAKEHGLDDIVDFYSGIGATSKLMAELSGLPVVAHASMGANAQATIIHALGLHVLHADRVPTRSGGNSMFCAFEVFEHIEDPLALVDEVTRKGYRFIAEASSFNQPDYGHFPSYAGNVPRAQMNRVFRTGLRERGWKEAASGWNSRPMIWERA